MWGSHLFGELGALFRRSSTAVSEESSEAIDIDVETAPGMTGVGDYEAHEVETGNGKARIFVARRASSYFDEDEEYSPTIVSAPRQSINYSHRRTLADTPTGESPADLFINAIRKPVRQITADMEPVIIRKERIAPSPAFEAKPVVEEPVVVAPAEPVIEIAVPVADTTVSIEVPAEPEPVVSVTDVEVIPEVSVVEAVPEATVDESVIEDFEIMASAVECALAHAEEPVVTEEVVAAQLAEIAVEAEPVAEVIEQPMVAEEVAVEAEPVVEAPVEEIVEVAPVAEPVEAESAEETVEPVQETPATYALSAPKTVMLALPPRLEIRSLPAAPEAAEEPVQETEPVQVTVSLPKKIEVEPLEPVMQETQIAEYANPVAPAEATATSAGAVQEPVTVDTLVDVSTAPALELENPDDVLLAFYPELRNESDEMTLTSMEINKPLPEDVLDKTECTFKLKIRRVYPTYNGYMRHIANH